MFVSIAEIEQMVANFLWPLFRIGSFFMAIPIIGTQLVPQRVRLGLAIAVTVVLMPVLPDMPRLEGLSLATWVVIAQQIVIGTVFGFTLHLLFQSFVAGAQIIAMQSGLGFSQMSDPANGISIVVVAQFYLMMSTLLFLAMNGHLVMIEILVRSFFVIPVGESGFTPDIFMRVALSLSWLFVGALVMALPASIALLTINLAFGVMTKAAPQLNIFAIGFPFSMLMGLLFHWINIPIFYDHYIRMSDFVLDFIAGFLNGGALLNG
ncbi:flagellar biosynthetic protein FliR [Nitrincola alkalilacustris]|uniref:flagellar biosynthetic protein FliR n=1 Tax=Nitrincola alkalilacustris TaxID=1571224 RepID=UPI00124D1D83|nr:flagellar biosynthetic protein FliR [Nitrincola alkalilacustris]